MRYTLKYHSLRRKEKNNQLKESRVVMKPFHEMNKKQSKFVEINTLTFLDIINRKKEHTSKMNAFLASRLNLNMNRGLKE